MPIRKHLIIGCGVAALAAARKIRSLCPQDEIKCVTREDLMPYCIAALPYLLSGKIKESDLWLADSGYLQALGLTLARGKEVTKVNPDKKQITYADGEPESYDTLLIASGSHPLKPDTKGLDKVSFLPFHTLSDFRLLQQRLTGKKDVAIYGGGLVAMELAVALLEAGYLVKLVVRSRILRRYFAPEAVDMIKSILTSKGAQIYEGCTIQEIKENKKRMELALSDGTTLNTEAIAIGLGVEPSMSFLAGTDIKLNDGVLVDRRMKTNLPDIYAAGDVAEAPDFFAGKPGMNPIILSAVDQGKIAGSNMAGTEAEYEGWISANIFHFFGNTAFSVGLSMPTNNNYEVLTQKDVQKARLSKVVYSADRLVGAMFVNIDLNPGVIQYLIRNRVNVSSYKKQLFERPREISRWLMLSNEKEQSKSLEV